VGGAFGKNNIPLLRSRYWLHNVTEKLGLERDELISVLFMVLLFVAVLGGRELGNIYGSFQEVSKLKVMLELDEEETATFLEEILQGENPDLDIGVALTLPSVTNVEGMVTRLPDYTRKWLISVTVAPVLVHPPEVSEVEIDIKVEDEVVQTVAFDFGREKIHYLSYRDKTMPLIIDDPDRFREAVLDASERYGGEVMLTLTGRAQVHVLFLNDWLPFSTTRFPLVKLPHLEYISSEWTELNGQPVTRLQVGRSAQVTFEMNNPTRVHSIHENISVAIFQEGVDEPVYTDVKTASVAPDSKATYTFQFLPPEVGRYYYILDAPDAFTVNASSTNVLTVDDST
jgi:hypothetical protein